MSEIDFSAWEAPPPPDGLADAVIARMAEPEPLPEPTPRRRWVIAASAAAVLAIAGGVWAIVRNREPAPPDRGEVVADKAQHVELGGVSADLDRGADVRWHRTSHGLVVEQRAGAASWHIGRDEHMTIGAAVASIEATGDAAGASLRVEVPMNLSDAKVIGASAVTAATVAMLTVVVYEGHVKVASSGKTVVVQPGTTYTVQPAAPQPVTVAHDKRTIAVLGLEGWNGDAVPHELVNDLRDRAKVGSGSFQLAPASDKELVDEKLLHDCEAEAPACMAAIGNDIGADALIYGSITSQRVGYEVTLKLFDVGHQRVERSSTHLIVASDSQGPQLAGWAARLYNELAGDDTRPDVPDEAAVQQILAANADELRACLDRSALLGVTITPFGKVATVTVDGTDAPPCISNEINDLAFPASKQGGTFTRKLQKPGCDVDALIEEGNSYMSTRGDANAALAKYEAAIACKDDERTQRLAFMAACNATNVTKAREHWAKLPEKSRTMMLQMCVRNGITRDQLDTSCDADDLQNKGMTEEQVGQHAAALAEFEAATRCKNANLTRLYQLSFMASCNAKSVPKARQYWAKIPSASAQMLKQMCVRNGITEDMLDGGQATPPPPAGQGGLRIDGVPPADILLDGKPVGHTPLVLTATPGKHKVTYVVAGDRFTYNVIVKAGETETLSKDLQ